MHDITSVWMWMGFIVFLIFALILDTFYLKHTHTNSHQSIRIALTWTIIWIVLALIFNLILWGYLYLTDSKAVANAIALTFFTGYLIEKTLSLDNLFSFYMIFKQLQIPAHLQQRVFAFGVWSAIVFRLVLIFIGSKLVNNFHWILYLMGLFLVITGFKMLFIKEQSDKHFMERHIFLWLKKFVPITAQFKGQHFFIRIEHVLYATPLFIALIFIEFADIVFSLDSIPAIFAITTDPFIVWTSNIFAILGLRALYFIIVSMVNRLQFLKYGIALILMLVGFKMLIEPWWVISPNFSLLIITTIIFIFSIISVSIM